MWELFFILEINLFNDFMIKQLLIHLLIYLRSMASLSIHQFFLLKYKLKEKKGLSSRSFDYFLKI